MKLMSCKRAEKLMPLYAAGDLPPGWRKRAVAAHVARCASCAALSEEFRASREWVRAAGEAPEFGDDFYERLRAGVLDEINRDTRPAAPERFAPLFAATFARPRLAYAASLALAAFAIALALYFGRDDASRPQRNDIADTQPAGKLIGTPQPARAEPTPGASPDEGETAQPKIKQAGGSFKRTPTLRHNTPTPATARARELPENLGRVLELIRHDVASYQGTANIPALRGRAPTAPRAETASVARIEIQTADPNIRIIWLAPDTGEETEPERVDPER